MRGNDQGYSPGNGCVPMVELDRWLVWARRVVVAGSIAALFYCGWALADASLYSR